MAEKYPEAHERKDKIQQCKVCKIKFPDPYSYIEHLESREHQKEVMKEKYGKKYLEAKAKMDANISSDGITEPTKKKTINEDNNNDHSDPENDDTDEDKDIAGDVYPCDVCHKVCTGFISYQLHLNGQKHKKNVKKEKLLKQLLDSNAIPKTVEKPPEEPSQFDGLFTKNEYASSRIECEVCNLKCCGSTAYKQHCKGEKHQKKLAMQSLQQSGGISLPLGGNDAVFAHCDICDKDFSGLMPYRQHMEGVTHLRQERNVKQLSEIKDLCISSEEDQKLQCKECGKSFSGPIPFMDHLKTNVHAKLKKKNDQMKALEQNHPGMVKIPLDEDSDEERTEDGNTSILGCDICGLVFSGPESARDHFESSKHKKVAQKKARMEKYAKMKNGGKPKETSASEARLKKTELKKEGGSSESDDEFEIIPES